MKTAISFTLLDVSGTEILKDVQKQIIRKFAKKTFYVSSKYVWRKTLEDKGYKIVNNY